MVSSIFQKNNVKNWRISALESNKWSNQKLLITVYSTQLVHKRNIYFPLFNQFLDSKAETHQIFLLENLWHSEITRPSRKNTCWRWYLHNSKNQSEVQNTKGNSTDYLVIKLVFWYISFFVLPNQNEISFPNNRVNLLLNTPCWKTNDVLFFIIVTLAFKQTGSNMIPHVATTLKNCAHFWDRKIIWPLPSDIYFALCA